MKNPFIAMALAISLATQKNAAALLAGLRDGTHQWRKPTAVRKGNNAGRYTPHQGKKECARRVKQLTKGAL